MIRELVHDPIFLAGASRQATIADQSIAADLLATLLAHKDTCVGMAANMIGERVRIIAFLDESEGATTYTVLYNPEVVKAEGGYTTEESCLSLLGGPRPCKRHRQIKVRYQTENMQVRLKTYTGFTAQIIEHEIDHCNGILI